MTAHAVLTEAARKVAEGDEKHSCLAICHLSDDHVTDAQWNARVFYNEFAPGGFFETDDFGRSFTPRQQTHRVLMLLFAAEFSRSEGVEN